MLFNSLEFFIFLVVMLLLYHNASFKIQNVLFLVGSYVFYAFWDWRFLFLVIFTTTMDFYCAKIMDKSSDRAVQKRILYGSIFVNLAILAVFKYFNFFYENIFDLLKLFSININHSFIKIILPVGISFYTFHSISYKIDVFNKKYTPVNKWIDFAIYIGFFPLLVAGPIERGKNLFPQITTPRKITPEKITTGIYLIFTGLCKKVLIADNLAVFVNNGFSNIESLNFLSALLTIYAFSWQIYCDFSGYSDIARGVAKLFGVELMLNFNLPYFSKNPSDFWKRWHISLSSWLRDYLYISLGGNRKGTFATYQNLFLTMLLGGLWHGASWNFVIWGAFQGLILIIYRIVSERFPDIKVPGFVSIIFFYQVICIGWIFFRADSVTQILQFFTAFTRFEGINLQSILTLISDNKLCIFLIPLIIAQVIQYKTNDSFIIFKMKPFLRPLVYLSIAIVTLMFGKWDSAAFIYFQF